MKNKGKYTVVPSADKGWDGFYGVSQPPGVETPDLLFAIVTHSGGGLNNSTKAWSKAALRQSRALARKHARMIAAALNAYEGRQ